MADTDEPFFQQKSNKSESHEISSNFSQHEYKSENVIESSQKFVSNGATVHKVSQPKKYTTSTTSAKKELTATPIITNLKTEKRHETFERNMEYIKNQGQTKTVKHPPVPSPSKFVKSEFRESDYESDYDKPIPVIWNPSGPDDSAHYRPVRPVLTPTGRKSQIGKTPTPPTEFEVPSKVDSMFRPKFEPIDKPKTTPTTHGLVKPETKNVVFKPRAISANQAADISRYIPLRPGTPPELAYATGPQTQIYRSTTSMPYHNAVQTETSNIVRFKESNEKCHRTVSVEQSTKVIKFGEKQNNIIVQPQKLEMMRPKIKAPPPASPKKFVPGESRETDYESDIENIKIKPKWAPSGSDTEDLHYRSVRPPSSASRSSSVPPTRDYIPHPWTLINVLRMNSKVVTMQKSLTITHIIK
ncbi:hypothetical protein WA026_021472 [Henosepilachna vigintioctopunctata]|uniref:Uncharacterized protein n=1 Tax=Henosepilachna vigintioctopunctata TaxID=420089 RepID=A0AAW1UNV9_9CUCU